MNQRDLRLLLQEISTKELKLCIYEGGIVTTHNTYDDSDYSIPRRLEIKPSGVFRITIGEFDLLDLVKSIAESPFLCDNCQPIRKVCPACQRLL